HVMGLDGVVTCGSRKPRRKLAQPLKDRGVHWDVLERVRAALSSIRRTKRLASTGRELSLPPDRDHRFVGSPAVDVPELLEIRPVEIGELLTGIGERGLELIRWRRATSSRSRPACLSARIFRPKDSIRRQSRAP